jgi:hypothetical protein
MTTTLLISIIGALTAIIVSLAGAWFANHNSIGMQIRRLKEEHYIAYIEAHHNLAAENDNNESKRKYVFARDKLLLIAHESVIKKMLLFENEAVGKISEQHDIYLTDLIKSIRTDLKMNDNSFPQVYFKK